MHKELVPHDFRSMMNACYFHPRRIYPDEQIRSLARRAMTMLWYTSELKVANLKSKQPEIRRLMVEEMTPDDLDRAISYGETLQWRFSLIAFTVLLFLFVLFSDEITQAEFEENYERRFAYADFYLQEQR